MSIELYAVPRLAPGVRLADEAQTPGVLLMPERALRLNDSSLEIVRMCDGNHTVQQIVEKLHAKYSKAEPLCIAKELLEYLTELQEARAIDLLSSPARSEPYGDCSDKTDFRKHQYVRLGNKILIKNPLPTPLALVAELTHRCPLHCVYCSNPVELSKRESELPTQTWMRLFEEAAEIGILQVDLTGGEPLLRADVAELVSAARGTGLYVSLITSGLPLDERKLAALVDAGLDHFQLSLQGATAETAREISNSAAHAQKLTVLHWLERHRIGVTLNFVIHRQNIHELEGMLAIVEEHRPDRVEFASVQYYGWGFANREALLPTRQQLDSCIKTLKAAEERWKGRTRVAFIVPDYYAKFPKPCVGGWGRKLMLVSPDGRVLPCHAATVIPGIRFESVNEKSLGEIWESSRAFCQFRGEEWMQEPCKSCDRRHLDFGGCRCQALLLAGDAASTDPVCSLAPARAKVDSILAAIDPEVSSGLTRKRPNYLYRPNPA
jgi:pyrroloquinoline quinone biosynthesis protein E